MRQGAADDENVVGGEGAEGVLQGFGKILLKLDGVLWQKLRSDGAKRCRIGGALAVDRGEGETGADRRDLAQDAGSVLVAEDVHEKMGAFSRKPGAHCLGKGLDCAHRPAR